MVRGGQYGHPMEYPVSSRPDIRQIQYRYRIRYSPNEISIKMTKWDFTVDVIN
jgi:hypothetical protein